jgi:SAM-dependent methyltransferase
MSPQEIATSRCPLVGDDWVALASPAPGVAMSSRVEAIAQHVRSGVQTTMQALEAPEAYAAAFAPRISGLGFSVTADELPERAARALVAEWLVGYAVGAVSNGASFAEAERWFYGGVELEHLGFGLRERFEAPCSRDEAFALLPYVLDALRPGTRRELLRDVSAASDRRIRKHFGAFYTPADVAAQMTRWVAPEPGNTCLDPACGTGVFLRAAVHQGELDAENVFGCDVDPAIVDAAAFVVLATTIASGWRLPSPWAGWHLARLNLATIDALQLTRCNHKAPSERTREVADIRRELLRGAIPAAAAQQAPSFELGELFPSLAGGAEIVLSNPPYAKIGRSANFIDLGGFRSLARARVTPSVRAEALFVEQLWRLTDPNSGRGSLVLPLSIASSSRAEFLGLRRAIQEQGGKWTFSFFDRAPDGLFGDDVKTRNSIVVYRAGGPRSMKTTGLLRWTSRTRRRFLETIKPVPVEADIADCIPKLGSSAEVDLYRAVRALSGRLRDDLLASRSGREVSAPTLFDGQGPAARLAVASTAYNWIGVVRDPAQLRVDGHTSENTLSQLTLATTELADAAYAVLSSRIVFWLWRVESDGFHVTGRFLEDLPFRLSVLGDSLLCLAELGRQLWEDVLGRAIWSINKGRRTVAYPPIHSPVLDVVDDAVLEAFGLREHAERCDVRQWHQNVVVVDFSEHKRLAQLAGGTRA